MKRARLSGVHADNDEFVMPADDRVHLTAETFRMLADPTRIKILWALLQGESSVNCLADLCHAPAGAVSQHLAKLRLAGLVRTRREGTFIYYTAADSHVRSLLDEALFHAEHTDEVADDSTHRHETPAGRRGHKRRGLA